MNIQTYHVVIWHLLGIDIDTGNGWLDGLLGTATLIIAFIGIGWVGKRLVSSSKPKPVKAKKNGNAN
jgi:hypothetical protein